jgi:hypothetical protein
VSLGPVAGVLDSRVERDLEDTRLSVARSAERPAGVDLDDTVVRGSLPATTPGATDEDTVPPPALVEPPAPEPRPLPVAPPAGPPADAEPAPAGAPGFRLLLLDGTELPVDRPIYVGRRPSPPRIHTGPAPRLVTLRSPARELSATHLELRVVGGALVATDMRSTNGTVVGLPGSAPRTLIRGESAVVVPGTRIDLGEGAVLDVLAASEDS